MTRLYLPPELLIPEQIIITGDQARYLSLVLRAKPGDNLTIFDGSGFKYDCTIIRSHKKEVIAQKIKKETYSVESPISITLVQGLPKSDKMDLIVQKATELGIAKIIPLITERAEVRHTEKLSRWQKIAVAAAQQSGRDRVPEVAMTIAFGEYLEILPAENTGSVIPAETGIQKTKGLDSCRSLPSNVSVGSRDENMRRIIFSEEHKSRNLKQILNCLRETKKIIILVGPEGGFTTNEVTAAAERGFIEASLGPRILRTETAPIAAISIIQYELGDVG